MLSRYQPDVFLSDVYAPNQMLTSRWWLGSIDPESKAYEDVSEENRRLLWDEVISLYGQVDEIIGELLRNADDRQDAQQSRLPDRAI